MNSMEQGFSEADSHLASQEMSHFLWNPKAHPEDGGSIGLCNVGVLPQHNTMSQAGRTWLET